MTNDPCSLIQKIENFGQTRCAASRPKRYLWITIQSYIYKYPRIPGSNSVSAPTWQTIFTPPDQNRPLKYMFQVPQN